MWSCDSRPCLANHSIDQSESGRGQRRKPRRIAAECNEFNERGAKRMAQFSQPISTAEPPRVWRSRRPKGRSSSRQSELRWNRAGVEAAVRHRSGEASKHQRGSSNKTEIKTVVRASRGNNTKNETKFARFWGTRQEVPTHRWLAYYMIEIGLDFVIGPTRIPWRFSSGRTSQSRCRASR